MQLNSVLTSLRSQEGRGPRRVERLARHTLINPQNRCCYYPPFKGEETNESGISKTQSNGWEMEYFFETHLKISHRFQTLIPHRVSTDYWHNQTERRFVFKCVDIQNYWGHSPTLNELYGFAHRSIPNKIWLFLNPPETITPEYKIEQNRSRYFLPGRRLVVVGLCSTLITLLLAQTL